MQKQVISCPSQSELPLPPSSSLSSLRISSQETEASEDTSPSRSTQYNKVNSVQLGQLSAAMSFHCTKATSFQQISKGNQVSFLDNAKQTGYFQHLMEDSYVKLYPRYSWKLEFKFWDLFWDFFFSKRPVQKRANLSCFQIKSQTKKSLWVEKITSRVMWSQT